jgi:hypothetical protein
MSHGDETAGAPLFLREPPAHHARNVDGGKCRDLGDAPELGDDCGCRFTTELHARTMRLSHNRVNQHRASFAQDSTVRKVREAHMTRVGDPYVDWLKAGLKRAGKSQSELARAMGLDPSIINKIVNGKRTLKAPEIPIVAAFLGERPPTVGPTETTGESPSETSEVFPVTSLGLVQAPVVGTVEAGSFREVFVVDDVEPEMVVVPPDPRFPHARLIVFQVAGDSMNDLKPRPILEGDRLVAVAFEDVAHEVALRDGMTVVVQRTRDGGHMREWSVKQIELYEDHVDFCPRSTNPRHRPIRVARDAFADGGTEVEIIALVRQVMNTIPF